MKSFSPLARLAELDLEEAIIREGYMANMPGLFARIIAERLCEIYEEREFITASMVQERALRARDNLPSE